VQFYSVCRFHMCRYILHVLIPHVQFKLPTFILHNEKVCTQDVIYCVPSMRRTDLLIKWIFNFHNIMRHTNVIKPLNLKNILDLKLIKLLYFSRKYLKNLKLKKSQNRSFIIKVWYYRGENIGIIMLILVLNFFSSSWKALVSPHKILYF